MAEKPWPCLKCFATHGIVVQMEVITEDFCKCPRCGTEVWYDYEEPPDEEEFGIVVDNTPAVQYSILGGSAKPGGGSKSKSRRNKKLLMRKPTIAQINQALASGPSLPQKRKKGRPKKNIDKPE